MRSSSVPALAGEILSNRKPRSFLASVPERFAIRADLKKLRIAKDLDKVAIRAELVKMVMGLLENATVKADQQAIAGLIRTLSILVSHLKPLGKTEAAATVEQDDAVFRAAGKSGASVAVAADSEADGDGVAG